MNLKKEAVAGVTSFLAAAYLVVVIPSLLSTGGKDRAAATTACIASWHFQPRNGLYADFPFVVGPGLGGSVILGVTLTQVEHIPWPTGLGIAMLSGLLFLVLTVTGARALVVRWVPVQIKQGTRCFDRPVYCGVGLSSGGICRCQRAHQRPGLGDFSHPGALVALAGLLVILALEARRVRGALLIGIALATAAGLPLSVSHLPDSLFSLPQSPAPVLFNVDFAGALTAQALPYLFAFFRGRVLLDPGHHVGRWSQGRVDG